MRVEVESQGAKGRIERFVVRVVMPEALPPHHTEMLERVARSCPAHNTLIHESEVAVTIEQPVAVG
jgi:hypothetical protein